MKRMWSKEDLILKPVKIKEIAYTLNSARTEDSFEDKGVYLIEVKNVTSDTTSPLMILNNSTGDTEFVTNYLYSSDGNFYRLNIDMNSSKIHIVSIGTNVAVDEINVIIYKLL